MQTQHRQFVLDQLRSSHTRLLALVDGLTSAQWHFRESPDRWSIAENLEHLVAFEAFIRGAIERTLQTPATPEKQAEAATKQPLVLGLAQARQVKFNAREGVRPTGNPLDPAQLITALSATRAQTIAFATATEAPLRDHFFPHIAFGDLDCYQWLIVLGQHTERHVRQIEQVMADPAYPAQ